MLRFADWEGLGLELISVDGVDAPLRAWHPQVAEGFALTAKLRGLSSSSAAIAEKAQRIGLLADELSALVQPSSVYGQLPPRLRS